MEANKPRAPRSSLVAEAEIFDQQSGQSSQAATVDLSMGGCYLEMLDPLPVRAVVRLKLTYNDSSLTLFGDVARSQPGTGMAVRFRALQPNQMDTLKGWIFSLDRPAWLGEV
jgi:hypothetical protein